MDPFERIEYAGQEWKSLTLRGGQVRGRLFESCTFVKCSFRETEFQECTFRSCVFRGCDLGMVHLKGCDFSDVRFEGCQLIGINWTETLWEKGVFLKPVDFFNCVLNHSSFLGLNLKKVSLAHCTAQDVDFAEANLNACDCRYTDFRDSRFLHTELGEADFTGAQNYAISPTLNTLKKTKFSLPEAMALLYGLDIVLTESS
jgi:fluoroquinolone resistance protein